MIVSVLDILRAAKRAGFVYNQGLAIAVAVSCAEDPTHETTAVFVNSDSWASRDRGPWMLNDHWHAEVSDACAFDLDCAAKETYRISGQGKTWTAWSTFTSGKYRQYMELARTVNALDEALTGLDTSQKNLAATQTELQQTLADRDAARTALAADDAKLAQTKQSLASLVAGL